MKFLAALLLLAAPALVAGLRAEDHPIAGVIKTLQKFAAEAEEEAKSEALTYEKFTYWCKHSQKSLGSSIAEEKADISSLSDMISSKEKEKEVLTDEIAELAEELVQQAAADKTAADSRADAKAIYDESSAALSKTISAIQDCIKILEDTKGSTDTGLLQQKVGKVLELASVWKGGEDVSSEQKALLQGLLAKQRPDQLAAGDRSAHEKGYAFKSGSVVELLKGLEAKFKDEETEVIKAETNSINAYELAKAARQDLVDAATKSKETKTAALGDCEGALATAKGERDNRQGDLDMDSQALKQTTTECRTKATEWEERSATRKGELEAIEKAVEILSKASGVRTEAPSNPVPPPAPGAAFLQGPGKAADPRKMKAVELLRQEARVAHSKALEQLAAQVEAHLTGPFDEVNNMVEKMIFRLMDEQKNEDEHKHWCDLELEKSQTSKDDKEDKLEELRTKIEEHTARSALMQQAITDATAKAQAIESHIKEATEIRQAGKEENKLAVKDAEDAQAALSQAVAVLEAFYKESGEIKKESWEFVQRSAQPVALPDQPSTWDSAYTGGAGGASGAFIVGMLEKISADFARMESETRAQEQSDQEAYDEDMKECSIRKARLAKEAEMKQQEAKRVDTKVDSMTKSKKHVEKEHEAVEQYLSDLKPACVSGDSTYEERKAARAKEIDALKEAKGILADAFGKQPGTTFLQKRK